MRSNQVKGIVHDLIEFRDYWNPLSRTPVSKFFKNTNLKIDLLTGKIIPSAREEDSLTDLLKEKRKWFVNFIKKNKAKLSDFDKATITIISKKEKINIEYKGKKYSKEKVW